MKLSFLTFYTAAVSASLLFTQCRNSVSWETDYEPVDYVRTLVGTESTYELSAGNTYPAVAMPWGMNFWTPQTGRNGDGWTYKYSATKIRGLKQTHQPSPWINDYGAFSIMPVTTGPVFDEDARESWFSHKSEIATPYYYRVYLADHDVVAEVSPSERAAAFRLTYPENGQSYLVVDAYRGGSSVRVIPEKNMIVGYASNNHGGVPANFRNWFVIVSDTPFTSVETVEGGKVTGRVETEGDHALALVGFRTQRGQEVNLKVASSFISAEQAELNLKEIDGMSFDDVKTACRSRWNETLGRIMVKDNNIDHLRTFYSCLYRALLFPRDLSEINAAGERVHYSPYNGEVRPGYMTTDTGFWDTFRSLFPLMNLIYPEQSVKVQEGLVNAYLESGFLPEWASPGHRGCMVGNNSASVVADAYINGIRGYDAETLWKAVTSDAHSVHPQVESTGRLGWEYYDRLGYVPCNVGINENAARTLEYAYDDWCIYRFGQALGKPESEIEPYRKAAMNYRNLYNPEHRLMAGRNEDGSFPEKFSPLKWGGDFTEGNSLHYTWSVFHDPAGLIELMGGDEKFGEMMDSVFNIPPHFDDSYYGFPIHEIREMQVMNMGNYAHGNQPIQHFIYLYNWCGQPWKAQARIREVMEKFYTPAPDGYCGDEDNGQTSAWYVFSALGFYPVCPASGQFAVGTPLFREVSVKMPGGRTLRISAPDNSDKNFYIKSMKVDGREVSRSWLTYDELVAGPEIVFNMTDVPLMSRGADIPDRPYSFSFE
ncbi:MAG: GH92 family glycosyl hydrolase [Bacteroidales bacterium]|nr:GH92 family glycosyl hydrolase [Bacteroidales bacterium]